VVDEFTPPVTVGVTLSGSVCVKEGEEYTPTMCEELPSVRFAGEAGKLYTLILSDPDAPSVAEPKFAEWQHWIVCNIPGDGAADGSALAAADVATEYFGSAPGQGSGVHRYCFVLYEQAGFVSDLTRIPRKSGFAVRRNFNSRKFASEHGLRPVAVLTYRAQWDERVSSLAASIAV
jgi:hypothetical protein